MLSIQAPFFFIPMAASLVNDESAKCRRLTGLAIKSLLEKIDNNDRTSLFTIVIKWLMDKLVIICSPFKRIKILEEMVRKKFNLLVT